MTELQVSLISRSNPFAAAFHKSTPSPLFLHMGGRVTLICAGDPGPQPACDTLRVTLEGGRKSALAASRARQVQGINGTKKQRPSQ